MASGGTTAPCSGWEEVLLDAHAYIGDNPNSSTAEGLTRNGERIVASFWAAHAPLPSRLYVHCPDLDPSSFSEIPRILCMVEDTILIRVAIRCLHPDFIRMEECDYFLYRVDLPSLERLTHPHPVCFEDEDVGLLPLCDRCTVAALVATDNPAVFTLHLLHSETGGWTSIAVSLVAPQEEFPMEIPENACQLFSHRTSTVITLGGEGGTMGWVDLWRGILLCDVLSPDPVLRGVPVPLPILRLNRNGGKGARLGCPEPLRGIAFIKGKGCLRFVDLDIHRTFLSGLDKETGNIAVRSDYWTITTWSNFKMTNSFEDWEMECQCVQAKDIECNKEMHLQLREYKLLGPITQPQDSNAVAPPVQNLQNLFVSHPTPSMMDGSNVVYMMARAKFLHPKACVLAIAMEKIKLQSVSEFGTQKELGVDVIFRPGSVSKLLMHRTASQGNGDPASCIQVQEGGSTSKDLLGVMQGRNSVRQEMISR